MTQILATTRLPIPARRRAARAVPILIQIPDLAGSRAAGRPVRRRRLRREVRVAGYALLGLLPIWLAIATLGGDRLPRLAASSRTAAAEADSGSIREVPTVSLSLEPMSSGPIDLEAPVVLPVLLQPVAPTEEDADGRH